MAEDELVDRLVRIARREGVSFAEIVRQGLEMRARQERPRPASIGIADVEGIPDNLAEAASDMAFEPPAWR